MTPGTQVAHYEILSAIGKGGMGEVYRARDTKLGREVAIKTLPPEFAEDPDRLARFEREAKLLASLNHPNIAAIYGLEEHEGSRFLVLELVEGDTLADRLKRGAIPVEESLKVALQIADALKAAHESGVIHRDLKPDNIKVSDDGDVKVLDFGLAKAMAADETDAAVSNSPTLSMAATQAGVILGTAAYMSPEQAKGRAVDRRADVWAFGAVLYEMLTGRQSFGKSDVTESLSAVISLQPEWDALPRNLHPRLRETVERCLEKPVVKRYQDIGDVKNDIEKVLADPRGAIVEPADEVVQVAPQSKLPWVAAIVLAALIAGLAGVVLTPDPAVRVNRSEFIPLGEAALRISGGRRDLAISPDGTHLVYSTTGASLLYIRDLGQFEATELSDVNGARDPVFSPDGSEVAFHVATDTTLRKMSVLGGPTQVIADVGGNLDGASWGRDGTIVYALQGGNELLSVAAVGGEPAVLTMLEEAEIVRPEILPDGRTVLFTAWSGSADTSQVIAFDLETEEQTVVIPVGTSPQYTTTGHVVYAVDNTLWAVPFDMDGLVVTGDPVPVVEDVSTKGSGAANFDVSDNGVLVYTPGSGPIAVDQATLVLVDRNGNPEPISDELRPYWRPRVSPDGTRIAVEVNDGNAIHIWLMDVATGIGEQFTFEGSFNGFPVWTADSQTVIFQSDRLGESTTAILSQPADLSGPGQVIIERDQGVANPNHVSQDGILVFQQGLPGDLDIWTVDLNTPDSPEEFLATEFNERLGRFSPDGQWLAYVSNEQGENRVYVRPYPITSASPRQIADQERSAPVWSPDGLELYSIGAVPLGRPLIATPVQTAPAFSVGRPQELMNSMGRLTGDINFSFLYDIMPDGEHFVFVAGSEATGGDAPPAQINIVQNWFEELKERVPVP